MKLQNYVLGHWLDGTGEGQVLYDASTGDEVALASSEGIDFGAMFEYGRKIGNRNKTWYEFNIANNGLYWIYAFDGTEL